MIKICKKRACDLSYNVIFLNVTRYVILMYCCKCLFQLSAVSLNIVLLRSLY